MLYLEKDIIENSIFNPTSETYKNFDNILVSINNSFSEMSKYNLIKQSDFCILVGSSGKVSEGLLKKYIGLIEMMKKKCAGFILIK